MENGAKALEIYFDTDSSDDDLIMLPTRRRNPSSLRFTGDAPADYDFDSKSEKASRPRRRNNRRQVRYTDFFEMPESSSDDDADQEESSEDKIYVRHSNRQSSKRKSRRRRDVGSSLDDVQSSSSARNHRRSSRQRNVTHRNLRERHEDDLSEAESVGPRRPKYTSAKESFRKVSGDDEFRLCHLEFCFTCGNYGDDKNRGRLIFCQGCSFSYHHACLGPRSTREHLVTKIDESDFILQCRFCLGISHSKHDIVPHTGRCSACTALGPMSEPLRDRLTPKQEQQLRIENGGLDPATSVDPEQVNNAENVLFRCPTCHRGFHAEHLPPIEDVHSSDLYDHYSAHWRCYECEANSSSVEKLVAWRPINPDQKVGRGTGAAQLIPGDQKEYLVKWKDQSYFRAKWMPGDWIWGVTKSAMRRAFYKTPQGAAPILTSEKAIPEDFLRIDIVFDVTYYREDPTDEERTDLGMVKEAYVKYQGLNYEDSVREIPPGPDDTERWMDFKSAFDDFIRRDSINLPDRHVLEKHLRRVRGLDFEDKLELHKQPGLMGDDPSMEMMDFQLEGVNWLYYKFLQKQNAILADDMGLGKTIQVIGFLTTLIERHACWPFLVVAPNATIPNWRREIKKWAPTVGVATYFGSSYARKLAKDYEMFPDSPENLRCHVVIASYESMIEGETRRALGKVPWGGLVVDEGQRLKNDASQLYDSLRRLRVDFKLLLSGTPLQNNIRELFNLIQFLDPERDAMELEEEYSELNTENIRELHDMIRPFFLRRTKAQVLPFLPPMAQIIVPLSMSILQKTIYKNILAKNPQLLHAIMHSQVQGMAKKEKGNLNNILMQLRKCLCHPYVFSREIEEAEPDPQVALQRLIEASGKFKLLNMMLPKLQERGHRVLIFSQFLENLDIVEDFLTGIGIKYGRLDGRMTAREKMKQVDDFNAPDSTFTAFLLSTRAGGVGINLATADTVIIMDPDFNPKQDMQALSRAHRIGQKNTVMVFQLTTKGSVEEKIMQRGKKKLALDHVLIERMEHDEENEDLESVLRHGAQALFKDDDDSTDIRYDAESIDRLLDRSQIEKDATATAADDNIGEQPQFGFARIWQNKGGTLEEVVETEEAPIDEKYWEEILRERERQAVEQAHRNAQRLGRGKRKRDTTFYGQMGEDIMDIDDSPQKPTPVKGRKTKRTKRGDSDVEFEEKINSGSSSAEEDPVIFDADDQEIRLPSKKQRPFQRVVVPHPNLPLGTDGNLDSGPFECPACSNFHNAGSCPLKLAGTESCPLCGLAHFGGRRICPHLQSQIQVRRMLDALKKSKEPPELVTTAKKYLQGLMHSLTKMDRKKESRDQAQQAQPYSGMFEEYAFSNPSNTENSAFETSQPSTNAHYGRPSLSQGSIGHGYAQGLQATRFEPPDPVHYPTQGQSATAISSDNTIEDVVDLT